MTHPLRENLEVTDESGAPSIRCSKCQHRYCRADQDWREFATVRLSPPANAGNLFSILEGGYLLRQLFCPSCAALVETDFIESDQAAIKA
jgi:acetone carboxylase gamma subunit